MSSLVEKNKKTGTSKMQLRTCLEKIEKLTNEAHQIFEWLNLSDVSKGSEKQPVAINSRTTATSTVKVIGRDEDREKIVAMLYEKAGHGHINTDSGLCYSVVGIHGVSGSGKSTLAQFVYAQEEKDGHFDCVMWSHVSRKFSVGDIYKQMIHALAAQAYEPSFLHILQDTLKEKLSGRRFLLVLDDVWCNKDVVEQNQAQLLSVLDGGKRGSKILVTSRNEDAFSDFAPDVRCITLPIGQLDDCTFKELFMYYALGDGADGSTLRHIGESIAEKLKKSPLAARTVGEQLRKRQNVEYWRRTKDRDLLNETIGALSWSYQHLNEQLRRCFAYCSMFPNGHHFRRNELVKLWVAEGFIRSTNAGEEMEDVGQDYFDELVSISFLQLGKESWGEDCYVMHDLVHDLAERIAGSDCYRIENGWKGKVPPGVRHLYVGTFDAEKADEDTIELENLRTLIIKNVCYTYNSMKILKKMFTRLRKLRVLNIRFINPNLAKELVSIIGLLKHLRHLTVKIHSGKSLCLTLPASFKKIHQIQTIDFGSVGFFRLSEGEDKINLVSLRHVETSNFWNVVNIVSSTSAQQLGALALSEKHGHNIDQLRDLNKIRGRLSISGLGIVKSKKEALQARLADKQRLIGLALSWGNEGSLDYGYYENSYSPDVKLEVLEGLCPQKDLEELILTKYSGPRYPNWMVGRQNGGPNRLQVLDLRECSLLGLAPVFEVFTQLRVLSLEGCDWVTLPDTMVHLKSLKKLSIYYFPNIEYLPVLPQSIEEFELKRCSRVFTRSCQTIENPNWKKIQHIQKRDIKMEGVTFDEDFLIFIG
ncbi:putative disease resistance RPP13-like protein 1 [Lolium rigidum]|uniref:putative disease resistance RPP13-like protein 1 n=1 Tax=Lolium rigidum TaxID=89674 RepID=UPI001F5E0D27|nr:putative disease resistance RPP13-like protein 1 [Lolium rigidum]